MCHIGCMYRIRCYYRLSLSYALGPSFYQFMYIHFHNAILFVYFYEIQIYIQIEIYGLEISQVQFEHVLKLITTWVKTPNIPTIMRHINRLLW